MELNIHDSCKGAVQRVMEHLNGMPAAAKALADCVLTVGPANDSRFGISDSVFFPEYVGDSAHIGQKFSTAEVDALAKRNARAVGMKFQYNPESRKYDLHFGKNPNYAADGNYVGDAVDLIAAQTITPWSVNWFTNIFKQPLAWSAARKLVDIEQGNDPWAEVMSMPLATFSGFAALNNAGSVSNSKTQDVEVQTGMMTRVIINMDVSYKITVEELNRLQSSRAPWAGSMIALKQEYANWVLEMLTDVLIYYGNPPTNTDGIFTVSAPVAWSSEGSSLTAIQNGASTSKGSDMYALFANVLAAYMTTNMNKLTDIEIAMSPLAYNIFSKQSYSSVYEAKGAMKTFLENFDGGEGEEGGKPSIKIWADPLLSPSTVFNALATDYLVISSPRIGGGPDDTPQPLVRLGMPLNDFVYPVIPGQYHNQHKQLRRTAGIFAPYTAAIQVFTGFGV